MTSYLPALLIIRADLHTIVNEIAAYEIACKRLEWGADVAKKQAAAVHTIQRRLRGAYDRLDLGSTERERLHKQMEAMKDELNALRFTNARLVETNQQLTAANVRLMQGSAA